MKKLILILLLFSAACFIAFGISDGISRRQSHVSQNSHVPIYEDTAYTIIDKGTIFSEMATADKNWEIVNEFPNININAAGATTVITQHDGERILVDAKIPDGRELYVGAEYNGDDLTIEIRPRNITFSDIVDEFGKVLWSDDVFKFPEGVIVTVSFPQTIYDNVDIKLGSGKMYVDELYANDTNVNIGSGTLEMQRSSDYRANSFNLELGSGKAKVNNVCAEYNSLDIGSGDFIVAGLTGDGTIDMGSGSGSVILSNDCKKLKTDISSGALDIYVWASGADVSADIGSGAVEVNAYGMFESLGSHNNGETVTCGYGATDIKINMSSGNVKIMESTFAPSAEVTIPISTDNEYEIGEQYPDIEEQTEITQGFPTDTGI